MKKAIALILCAIMLVSIVSCGSDKFAKVKNAHLKYDEDEPTVGEIIDSFKDFALEKEEIDSFTVDWEKGWNYDDVPDEEFIDYLKENYEEDVNENTIPYTCVVSIKGSNDGEDAEIYSKMFIFYYAEEDLVYERSEYRIEASGDHKDEKTYRHDFDSFIDIMLRNLKNNDD